MVRSSSTTRTAPSGSRRYSVSRAGPSRARVPARNRPAGSHLPSLSRRGSPVATSRTTSVRASGVRRMTVWWAATRRAPRSVTTTAPMVRSTTVARSCSMRSPISRPVWTVPVPMSIQWSRRECGSQTGHSARSYWSAVAGRAANSWMMPVIGRHRRGRRCRPRRGWGDLPSHRAFPPSGRRRTRPRRVGRQGASARLAPRGSPRRSCPRHR